MEERRLNAAPDVGLLEAALHCETRRLGNLVVAALALALESIAGLAILTEEALPKIS